MEQTGRIKPRCIGLQADQNKAGWNTLTTEDRAVSVSMQIKHSRMEHSDH
jgi:hypothetical protein